MPYKHDITNYQIIASHFLLTAFGLFHFLMMMIIIIIIIIIIIVIIIIIIIIIIINIYWLSYKGYTSCKPVHISLPNIQIIQNNREIEVYTVSVNFNIIAKHVAMPRLSMAMYIVSSLFRN